jgi:hypothetical protein
MTTRSRILARSKDPTVAPSLRPVAFVARRPGPLEHRGRATSALVSLVIALQTGCRSTAGSPPLATCDESPGALYQRRIAPLLATDRPSTCNACHAGGIKLTDFARTTPCESMACLEQAGLVNLDSPESSVLLGWIRRADAATPAVSQALVDEEHDGFLEWIRHEAECRSCSNTECPDPAPAQCAVDWGEGGATGKDTPEIVSWDEMSDPGGCEQATIDALFRGTIYQHRDRCAPCHFVDDEGATASAPRFFSEKGGCQVGSLASETNILSRQLVDVEYSDASLLLLKPLAESDGGLPHGGDDKFTLEGDSGYFAFRYWVRRYAECARQKD